MNRSGLKGKETRNERLRIFKIHAVGIQIPRRFHPKIPHEADFGVLPKELGSVFKELTSQKETKIEEGHLMIDHVHMKLSIPPKYWVSHVVGFIKGKSAIWIAL